MFYTVLGQYSLIYDNVGWWSGFNKGGDGVDGFEIYLGNIIEDTGTNNQVALFYGEMVGFFVIVVDGGRIL